MSCENMGGEGRARPLLGAATTPAAGAGRPTPAAQEPEEGGQAEGQEGGGLAGPGDKAEGAAAGAADQVSGVLGAGRAGGTVWVVELQAESVLLMLSAEDIAGACMGACSVARMLPTSSAARGRGQGKGAGARPGVSSPLPHIPRVGAGARRTLRGASRRAPRSARRGAKRSCCARGLRGARRASSQRPRPAERGVLLRGSSTPQLAQRSRRRH